MRYFKASSQQPCRILRSIVGVDGYVLVGKVNAQYLSFHGSNTQINLNLTLQQTQSHRKLVASLTIHLKTTYLDKLPVRWLVVRAGIESTTRGLD